MKLFSNRTENKLPAITLFGVVVVSILIVLIGGLLDSWLQQRNENGAIASRIDSLKQRVAQMDVSETSVEETRDFSKKIELLNKSIGQRKISFMEHVTFIENHLPESLKCFEVGFSHEESRFYLKLDLVKANEDDLTAFVRELQANPNYQSVRVKPIGNMKDMKRELYGTLSDYP